jgi:hypothetical protein
VTAAPTGPIAERLCSLSAIRDGQDPIGSVGLTEGLLFVETPTPWADGFYDADAEGTIQQRIRAVMDAHLAARRSGAVETPWGLRNVYAIAPDRKWSDPGTRRVILARRTQSRFGEYELTEYRFERKDLGPVELAAAFTEGRYERERFAAHEVPRPPVREFFVCTHGHVDICCAKFGVPLYATLRGMPDVRAWRTSHFGGHRFAPTVKEFPNGYTWGFVDEEAARLIARRECEPHDVAGKVRGWCGVDGPLQPLDREGLLRFGWGWMSFAREGHLLVADPGTGRWEGRIDYEGPGARGAIEGTVVRARELPNRGCGAHWGEHEYLSPEFAVESVRFV